MSNWIAQSWAWIGLNSPAIQAVCIVLSAIAAFAVIWHNGRISRQSSTIGMVRNTFFDTKEKASYENFKDVIQKYEDNQTSLAVLADADHDKSDDTEAVLRQINSYEMVALGITKGVFDERFYKRWFFSQLTRDYRKVTPYIDAVRERYQNQAYFCEFEALANRWQRKRHPVKHPPRWKMLLWTATGQDTKVKQALDAQV